jgi:uncharacterized protein
MSENSLEKIKSVVLFVLVLNCSIAAHSASFDCAKASSKIEKMICADSALSKLDQDLGAIFKSAKSGDAEIIGEQKIWLQKKRNTCQDIDCLVNAYKGRIDELKGSKICPIKDDSLHGGWVRVKGGFFEEMNFSVDSGTQVFFSWIHHRPEMAGTWEVRQCTILIKSNSDEKMQFEFKVQKIEKDKLYVLDSETNMNAIYKKVKTAH